MNAIEQPLSRLTIPAEKKARRPLWPGGLIAVIAVLMVATGIVFIITRRDDRAPIPTKALPVGTPSRATTNPMTLTTPADVALTVTGHIVPRERIELSPKFMGTVRWIGVKKGDLVQQGDVIVRLEDAEYRARLLEAEGRLLAATANLTNATLNLERQLALAQNNVDSQRAADEARRLRDAALAEVMIAQGQLNLAQTYLDWCTIRAPITGTILEKLVDPNELVTPQSFGGTRGPSTAFVAMANLKDLQVEIDLNEADLSKVRLQQRCRVRPEAFPGKQYAGHVTEIAPEANRSKGTLQVKVQVENPDQFLTPELTARVEFLKD